MNKARRKSNRRSAFKRLVRESFLLSATRALSSRVVRFFQSGLMSRVLTSVKTTDRFIKKRVTGPLLKKTELRKNFSMPARNAIASFCSNNNFFNRVSSARASLLNTPIRSIGIFLFTFGVYAAAMILFKRFVNLPLGEASADDLIFSGLVLIAGALLTLFGDKSNIEVLSSGKILGSLLGGVLGVNDSALNKIPEKQSKTGAGVGFLLGSICGALTVFFSSVMIAIAILAFAVVSTIICIPEFGLMLTVATVAVLPINWVAAFAGVTLASYIIKCLRLKRNLRFGTADFIMLLLFLLTPFCGISFQGGTEKGGGYLIFGMALYFAAKNLVCTKKLLLQTFNALCMGSFLGMVVYAIGEIAYMIPHQQINALAEVISENAMSADMLAVLASVSLPFALSSFSEFGTQRRNWLYVVMAAVCAFLSGSMMFYILLAVSGFAYVALSYKAPVGAAISAGVSLPLIIGYAFAISHSGVISCFASLNFDSAFCLPWDFAASSFWGGFAKLNGGVCAVLCIGVVLLSLQRILATASLDRSAKITLLGGTVAASMIIMVVSAVLFNLLADLRIVAIFWFLLGLCGSTYTVLYNTEAEEV